MRIIEVHVTLEVEEYLDVILSELEGAIEDTIIFNNYGNVISIDTFEN